MFAKPAAPYGRGRFPVNTGRAPWVRQEVRVEHVERVERIEYDIYQPGTYIHSTIRRPHMRMTVFDASSGSLPMHEMRPVADLRSIMAVVSSSAVVSFIEHSTGPISLLQLQAEAKVQHPDNPIAQEDVDEATTME
ncbi:unnamed protein product, partial [Mesorhabditis spiculigera]